MNRSEPAAARARRLTLPLLLTLFALAPAAIAQTTNLTTEDGAVFDITDGTAALGDGASPDASSDGCDECLELYVDSELFDSGGVPGSTELDGRQLVFGPMTMSGLEVTRKVFVPAAGGEFGRWLNVLHNPTGAAITVDVAVVSENGHDDDTVIESGLPIRGSDPFVVMSDTRTGAASDPATLYIWDSARPLDGADRVQFPYWASNEFNKWNSENFAWEYLDVTVPAGGTVIFMNFMGVFDTVADATAAGEAMAELGLPDVMLDGLTADELETIVNYTTGDADDSGLDDFFERAHGVTGATGDADGDGLTNAEEQTAGTDPNEADTDGDGLSDGAEVDTHGTDPLRADTNGNGFSDAIDIALGRDPGSVSPGAESPVGNVVDGNLVLADVVQAMDVTPFVDGDGNIHIAFSANGPGDDGKVLSRSRMDPFYALMDPSGNVLVAPTALDGPDDFSEENSGDGKDAHAAVAASADGDTVYLIWLNDGCGETVFARIDLSGHPRDGSDAAGDIDFNDITFSGCQQPREMVVDSDGNVRFLVGALTYFKVDTDGAVIDEVALSTSNAHANASMVLDADENVHIVWQSGHATAAKEIRYTMLSGGDGSALIDDTLISVDDGNRDGFPNLMIDDAGILYVVWANNTDNDTGGSTAGAEMYFMALDPAQDDQDGSASDLATLEHIAHTQLTEIADGSAWYLSADWGADGNIHAVYAFNTGGQVGEDQREYQHLVIDTAGDIVAGPARFDTTAAGNFRNSTVKIAGAYAAFPSKGRANATGAVALKPLGHEIPGGGDGETPVVVAPTVPTASGSSTATGGRVLAAIASAGRLVVFEALESFELPAEALLNGFPDGHTFESGFFRAVVSDLTPGAVVDVTVTLPAAAPEDAVFFKWSPAGGWVEFPHAAGATDTQIVLTLTDGGPGDADGLANGVIVDPGGLGTPDPETPPVDPGDPTPTPITASSSGGGCALTDGGRGFDPTLPALLLLAGVFLFRRRSLRTR